LRCITANLQATAKLPTSFAISEEIARDIADQSREFVTGDLEFSRPHPYAHVLGHDLYEGDERRDRIQNV
jgi:hypothetical protein